MSYPMLSPRARRRRAAARRTEEKRWAELTGPVVIIRGPVKHDQELGRYSDDRAAG